MSATQRFRSPYTPERRPQVAPDWDREAREVAELDRAEHAREGEQRTRALMLLLGGAVVAGLLPAIFPLTPGFSARDTLAAVVAAGIAASAAVGIVPLTQGLATRISRSLRPNRLLYAIALCSAGAAAIHFSVAKTHFEEYTLFGVFFVGSGIAQLVWPIWVLLQRWRPLLVLGAVGNALIVALWAVDRIWGLPLGPEHWKPETVGFGDSVTSALELLLVAGCVALLAPDRERPLRRLSAAALVVAVTVVTTLGLLSVLGVGSSLLTPAA